MNEQYIKFCFRVLYSSFFLMDMPGRCYDPTYVKRGCSGQHMLCRSVMLMCVETGTVTSSIPALSFRIDKNRIISGQKETCLIPTDLQMARHFGRT